MPETKFEIGDKVRKINRDCWNTHHVYIVSEINFTYHKGRLVQYTYIVKGNDFVIEYFENQIEKVSE